jgi:hypothetical protein
MAGSAAIIAVLFSPTANIARQDAIKTALKSLIRNFENSEFGISRDPISERVAARRRPAKLPCGPDI